MKLTIFLLLFAVIQTMGFESFSQGTKFSLNFKNTSIKEVLSSIEDKTEYYFLYSSKVIDVDRKIDVDLNGKSISEALDQILKDTDIEYVFKDRQILLSSKNNYDRLTEITQQQKSISGKVTDSSGGTLPGVSVVVKGTTTGVITDMDGKYTLSKVPENATLQFSFVGMKTQEIVVGGKTSINVVLAEESIGIEEVVAIGYGTVRKSDLTGSVGSIKSEDISKQPVVGVDQALQGRIAGVQVSSTNGAPGSGSSIRIRGGNSINAGNEPLYVIDGFIGGGDLNSINSNDIESIEVLKDASSTAIYGSRGSNGVILITTKRGAKVKGFGVSLDSYVGIQTPVRKIDLLNGPEFAEYRNEYAKFVGNSIPFPNIDKVANTDWQDVLFRDVPMTSHTLNFFNNTANSNYYVSINYLNQDGIQLGSGFDRYQLRFNFDQNLGNILKVGASFNGSYSNTENPRASAIGAYVLPTAHIYKEDGSFDRVDAINGSTYNNPIAQDKLIIDNTYKNRALGNIYMQINPIKGLTAKSTFGFDIATTKQNQYYSVDLPTNYEKARGGQANVNTSFANSIQNENTVNYTKEVGKHEFNVLGGWTYQKYSSEGLNVAALGFTNDVTTYNAIQTGNPLFLKATSGETNWTLLSGLYRLNYSYAGKYLLTVSGRHDGSSRLAEGNKWQFFPSAAIAWRMSEENFIKKMGVFNNLKLRASYGKTGSQSIDPYSTLARLNSGYNYIGGQQVVAFSPAGSADPSLKWEVTDQYDAGLDAGFLDGKLNVELDYYYKKTSDLLLARELAFQTGFETRLENVGSLQNQGLDVTIRGTIIHKKDFSWSSDLTVSSNKNKILELSGAKEFIENGVGSRLIVGEDVSTFFGAKFIGLWQEGDKGIGGNNVPGAMKFEDVNGDGLITALDGQIIGKGTPDFFGGLNNVLTYKNFTFSAFIDFSFGNDIYDLAGRDFNTGHITNVYGKFRDRWTPENTGTDVPRAGTQLLNYYDSYSGREGNSFDVHDGSYLRLKTLNLQYKLPVGPKIFKSLVVYGTATNLFTLTKYEGFSPDVNAAGTNSTRRGFDSNGYPPAKLFLFGIKADF